ncbi:enoyl-CoA hydratase/isomerase family protein [Caldifermentibacillus hisashii]|uniref:enoyl-CoA hydratase/isomerase family protein n=1 Tax=Caldifermentibacillus hisashii TaxID=996558 RepID=UPI002E1C6311|nr:enoyl-CoA hydratase/isomerase family protein [Caldifermentibacillus hisashii]
MEFATITIQKRDKGVAWLMINNPPVNAINDTLMDDLEKAADVLEDDPDVRVIVIASQHPKILLAGADLKAMIANSADYAGEENGIEKGSMRMQNCFHRFSTLEKPVIAAINGHALGGGCELAMACDFRIMGKGRIGLTEVSLGILPGAGGTQRLTRLVGRAKALEMIFTAKQLEAKEAEEIGLIHRAVNPEHFEQEVTEFAELLAQGAVKAMGLAKRAVNAADLPIEKGLQIEAKAFAETFLTDEPAIGLTAFFNKEKATFI